MSTHEYIYLKPQEFQKELHRCPVAYLPLGTLEWHGKHLPLGADGIQSHYLFEQIAQRVGGIICPMLFLGPDQRSIVDGREYYGMDNGNYDPDPMQWYPPQKFAGSAYWIEESGFQILLDAVVKQLARAGFRMIVAHGHGPSTHFFQDRAEFYRLHHGVKCISCWQLEGDLSFQSDHGAMNETSILMAIHRELVSMDRLEQNLDIWPDGIGGKDPRLFANVQVGNEMIAKTIEKMVEIINRELGQKEVSS